MALNMGHPQIHFRSFLDPARCHFSFAICFSIYTPFMPLRLLSFCALSLFQMLVIYEQIDILREPINISTNGISKSMVSRNRHTAEESVTICAIGKHVKRMPLWICRTYDNYSQQMMPLASG